MVALHVLRADPLFPYTRALASEIFEAEGTVLKVIKVVQFILLEAGAAINDMVDLTAKVILIAAITFS